MNNLKLFRIESNGVTQLDGYSSEYEKPLQVLIQDNLEEFLGIRFVASEFRTDKEHGGRIDTLGLDNSGCPVVIEYKRSSNMNVINQGLFYLDWLVTHKGDFKIRVLENLGQRAAQSIRWSGTRLVCLANGFSKYDEHAIKQMNHNIDLIQYTRFGEDLIALEEIGSASKHYRTTAIRPVGSPARAKSESASDRLDRAPALAKLFEPLKHFLTNLGDDVEVQSLKRYFAFKRNRNFACIKIQPQKRRLLAYVSLDPDRQSLVDGFTRDVTNIGHFGTGDLEISIGSENDLEAAKVLFVKSYQNA